MNNLMKLLIVCPEYSIHSVKWLNAFAKKGYEVHSCFCKGQEEKMGMLDGKIIRHMMPFKAPFGYFLNIPYFRKIVKRIKPDIIHVHRASSYATLARLSKIKPDVLSIWGSDVYDFPYRSRRNKTVITKNLSYAKILASTSGEMAKQARFFLADKTKTIYVTPFGVDTSSFYPYHIQHPDIVVGTVKTLSPTYGIDTAIRSFANALSRLKDCKYNDIADKLKYYIYGKGPMLSELKNLIKELGLEDRIMLCGYIKNSEVPSVLNQFDVFLLASRSESFGVAAVEAMACSLPIIATKAPGFLEVVDNGVNGILVDIDNVDEMGNALFKMLTDSLLRKEYGQNARKKVLQLYDWKDNVDYMESLYLEAKND